MQSRFACRSVSQPGSDPVVGRWRVIRGEKLGVGTGAARTGGGRSARRCSEPYGKLGSEQ
jgi:hypothetical protein